MASYTHPKSVGFKSLSFSPFKENMFIASDSDNGLFMFDINSKGLVP